MFGQRTYGLPFLEAVYRISHKNIARRHVENTMNVMYSFGLGIDCVTKEGNSQPAGLFKFSQARNSYLL